MFVTGFDIESNHKYDFDVTTRRIFMQVGPLALETISVKDHQGMKHLIDMTSMLRYNLEN